MFHLITFFNSSIAKIVWIFFLVNFFNDYLGLERIIE